MPIHEYRCLDCEKSSDHLRGMRSEEPDPTCSHCGSARLERRLFTTFAAHTGSSRGGEAEPLCCGRDERPAGCQPGSCCGGH